MAGGELDGCSTGARIGMHYILVAMLCDVIEDCNGKGRSTVKHIFGHWVHYCAVNIVSIDLANCCFGTSFNLQVQQLSIPATNHHHLSFH